MSMKEPGLGRVPGEVGLGCSGGPDGRHQAKPDEEEGAGGEKGDRTHP